MGVLVTLSGAQVYFGPVWESPIGRIGSIPALTHQTAVDLGQHRLLEVILKYDWGGVQQLQARLGCPFSPGLS